MTEKTDNDFKTLTSFFQTKIEDEYVCRLLAWYFPLWFEEKQKAYILDHLDRQDQELIFQYILLLSYVGNEEDTRYNSDTPMAAEAGRTDTDEPDDVIPDLIRRIKSGEDEALKGLTAIFERNTACVRADFVSAIEEYRFLHLPAKKKEQVENLRKAGRTEQAEAVTESHYNGADSSAVENVRKLQKHLEHFDQISGLIDLSVFTSAAMKANPQLEKRLEALVRDPGCLIPQEAVNIQNNVKLPNNWYAYRMFTIDEYRKFCEIVSGDSDGTGTADMMSGLIARAGKSIFEKLRIPFEAFAVRKEVITEIFDSMADNRHQVALIALYAEIEGLLWDLSALVNSKGGSFQVYQGDALIDRTSGDGEADGKLFESNRIRDVLERTSVRSVIDEVFLREFCEEIYEERNPILHGRQNCFATCTKNAVCLTQKILALEYVIDLCAKMLQEHIFGVIDQVIGKERADRMVEDLLSGQG